MVKTQHTIHIIQTENALILMPTMHNVEVHN